MHSYFITTSRGLEVIAKLEIESMVPLARASIHLHDYEFAR
jgi:hypothetical protein